MTDPETETKDWTWQFRYRQLGVWLWRHKWKPIQALGWPVLALLNIDRWDREAAKRHWDRFGSAFRRNYLLPVMLLAIVLVPLWLYLLIEVATNLLAQLQDHIPPPSEAAERRAYFYGVGLTITGLGALLAAPFVLIKAWINERNTDAAEQGLITDRFTKAVEQLGRERTVNVPKTVRYRTVKYRPADHAKGERLPTVTETQGEALDLPPGATIVEREDEWQTRTLEETVEITEPNLEVRLGAIYALERIAEDSLRDHIPIMETLCAYLRENAPRAAPYAENHAKAPRIDIQTVLTVLGRRAPERIAYETGEDAEWPKYRLDLSATHLAGAELDEARLGPARLFRADLQGARLVRAKLQGAGLGGAKLQGARLGGAKLQGAWLAGADLQGAGLGGAKLQGARLGGANLKSADLSDWTIARTSLRSADFTDAKRLSPESVKSAFGVRAGIGLTILPEGVAYHQHWHKAADAEKDSLEAFIAYEEAYHDWLASLPPEEGGDG